MCDPVLGDKGRLYLPEELVPLYRDMVLPLADMVTPNAFEAQLLSGVTVRNQDDALRACAALHDLGPSTVVRRPSTTPTPPSLLPLATFPHCPTHRTCVETRHLPITASLWPAQCVGVIGYARLWLAHPASVAAYHHSPPIAHLPPSL